MVRWDLVSFVKRSSQRSKILSLLKKPMTPSEIAKATGMYLTHVSRTLRELRERNLVECLTPEERVGRYYRLTKLGKKILAEKERIFSKEVIENKS